MAVTNIDISVPSSAKRFSDSSAANAAVAVKASSGTVYALQIDNTANAAVSYVKLYDLAAGSVTVGTTAPDWIIKVPASTKVTLTFVDGLAFGTALSECCVTAGGTAGTTSPSSAVVVTIIYA